MNKRKIRDVWDWMRKKGVKQKDIVEKRGEIFPSLGKCSPSLVSRFLQGKKTSQVLVDTIVAMGCPEYCFKNGKPLEA